MHFYILRFRKIKNYPGFLSFRFSSLVLFFYLLAQLARKVWFFLGMGRGFRCVAGFLLCTWPGFSKDHLPTAFPHSLTRGQKEAQESLGSKKEEKPPILLDKTVTQKPQQDPDLTFKKPLQDHQFAQDQIHWVIIKGDDLEIDLKAHQDKKFLIKTDAMVQSSRKGRAIVIEAADREKCHCTLLAPPETAVIVFAGQLNINVQNMEGDLRITGGKVTCVGRSPLKNVHIIGGWAKINLQDMARDLTISCAHLEESDISWNESLTYFSKKPKGLVFMKPQRTRISFASGSVKLTYPKEVRLSYIRPTKGFSSTVPPTYKDFDAQIFTTMPPGSCQVFVSRKGEEQGTLWVPQSAPLGRKKKEEVRKKEVLQQ